MLLATTPIDVVTAALHQGNIALVLWLAFAAGVATSLTPCVYPLIAITVSIFGAHRAPSKLAAARLSTSFVLGLIALFAPLGVISAVTGVAFGSLLSSPWVLGALALLFAAMALSMFGAFEVSLPSRLQNRLSTMGGLGVRGAFVLGMVNALIAAPCTGPVLAVLLGWIATTKNVVIGTAAMAAYGAGLGLLFWIVGTFAIALPKTGRWVVAVKSVFGLIMLTLALYFARDLLALPLPSVKSRGWWIAGFALVGAGSALGAVTREFIHGAHRNNAFKATGIALITSGLLALVGWQQAVPAGAKIAWRSDLDDARSLAIASSSPLLVDFGADWCEACVELDKHVFSDPRVVHEAKRFITVRVDLSADAATDTGWEWLAAYQQHGLPLVVLHDQHGAEVQRVLGFVDADEFLRGMRAVR